jgi:adenylosuccinate lyase
MKDERVTQYLTEKDIDRILDPKGYVGLAPQITREMVNLSRKERGKD